VGFVTDSITDAYRDETMASRALRALPSLTPAGLSPNPDVLIGVHMRIGG
jgi:hypothetical protein